MSRQVISSKQCIPINRVSVYLLIVLFCVVPICQGRDLPDYQIKAAFLFNLVAFVNWPDDLFTSPSSPLRYCSLNAHAVSGILEQLISGEYLDGRPLEILRLDSATDATGCHVLYVGNLTAYDAVVQVGSRGSILTVGDTKAFVERGGMVALLHKRKRIHPAINLDAVEASSLRLSSKLLRLAKLIKTGKGG